MKFLNGGRRISGIAVPLLALRTSDGPCGEFPDLVPFARLARNWGAHLIQLLPVNETGAQTSPYSALSAFALNPVHIRLKDLPETLLPGAKSLLNEMSAMTTSYGVSKRVDYEAILHAKQDLLWRLWEVAYRAPGREGLFRHIDAWIQANPWAMPYALFMTIREENGGKPWWEWAHRRDIDDAAVFAAWKDVEILPKLKFRVWVQMRAFEQFEAASRAVQAEGVDLMGDIPILMNADSADVWKDRDIFDMTKTAGAPPDMYARLGQNWGFPLYRWDVLEARGFDFWKNRLACADHFYSAYRIDHVLGFFRIWAIGKGERDGFLGHFVPEFPVVYPELNSLGFDQYRIRWLSKPHVPESAVDEVLSRFAPEKRASIASRLFERIGDEPLFLFARGIHSASELANVVDGREDALELVLELWRNRALLEISSGQFVLSWEYRGTTAWASLSEQEKSSLEALFARRRAESMALWERAGKKILGALAASVSMQACAEDLGAVPPCVPSVLGELGIPGLRVLRWHRSWSEPGAPHILLDEYPEESVACMSVHDSTNLRQWWIDEADKPAVWATLRKADPDLPEAAPEVLDPESVARLTAAFGKARSRYAVYPLQDLLAAHALYREDDPRDERINVPGTSGGDNWLYRVKPELDTLSSDVDFARLMARVLSRD